MFVKLDFLDDHVTQLKYYKYRLFTRTNEFNILQRGNRLFQQWCVDMYAKILQYKLNYPRTHQADIRAELYKGLRDALNDEDIDPSKLGKKLILPASMSYTPRWYNAQYHDSMTIIQKFKKPDLFITFTTNPKWPEITRELFPGQKAIDRPELTDRIFHAKLKLLLQDLTSKNVFGNAVAWMHTVEFQKRGLPHAHILIILRPDCRLHNADDYDRIVSAEIPDPKKYPELHRLVKQFMIHRPCGRRSRQPCMKKGYCKHNFPKDFMQFTQSNEDGFPSYKRRSPNRGGHKAQIFVPGRGLITVDNRWVIPYNPYLIQKYNAHINVEVCSSILAIKYLYKYIYKGHDKASFKLKEQAKRVKNLNDEYERYYDALYISSSESCWKMLKYRMHSKKPAVQIQRIHLPDMQNIYYKPTQTIEEIIQDENAKKTMLTEWFTNNKLERISPLTEKQLLKDSEGNLRPRGPEITYLQYAEYYSWDNSKKKWKRRSDRLEVLGRMHRLSPKSGEIYYLRTLLLIATGAESWKDLLTYENKTYPSFQQVCAARGLLIDDGEWDRCLNDARQWHTGYNQLLGLFVTILTQCQPVYPLKLWNKYKADIGESIARKLEQQKKAKPKPEDVENLALLEIKTRLKMHKKELKDFNLPEPDLSTIDINPELEAELDYSIEECKTIVEEHVENMNEDQKTFYNAVKKSLEDKSTQKAFFINALGGTGKTYVAEALLAYVRSKKQIAIAVAFSGIAALLLPGGRTVHSRFNLPLEPDDSQMGHVKRGTNVAELIQKAKMILWDEAPMAHKNVLECIDNTLQDLMNNEQPFGGKIMVFSGDFRQVLPIIPRASRAQIVTSALNRSHLWQHIKLYHLKINERIRRQSAKNNNTTELKQFADDLEKIGDGTYPINQDIGSDMIKIPSNWLSKASNLEEFIEEAFPNLAYNYNNSELMKGRAILTPKNIDANKINKLILEKMPGEIEASYRSIDRNLAEPNTFQWGEEVLNSLDPNGLPPHILHLKKHAIIMVLRNIDPYEGVCNGTRLEVLRFTDTVIEARILTGPKDKIGKLYFIPRIKLQANKTSPISFYRRQFPVKLAFAMTINKSQGQTLDFMALYLPEPVFGHGQLYVAAGRVGSDKQLSIFIVNGKAQGCFPPHKGIYTRNVVYKEVFNPDYEPDYEFEEDNEMNDAFEFVHTEFEEEGYNFAEHCIDSEDEEKQIQLIQNPSSRYRNADRYCRKEDKMEDDESENES